MASASLLCHVLCWTFFLHTVVLYLTAALTLYLISAIYGNVKRKCKNFSHFLYLIWFPLKNMLLKPHLSFVAQSF